MNSTNANTTVSTPYGPASRVLGGDTLKETRLGLSAILFGTNASWMLLGFIFVQTYTYHHHCETKPDPRFVTLIVYGLVAFQICQTALDSFSAYRELVFGWGDPYINSDLIFSVMNNLPPLLDAFAGAVVQYYYLFRIWYLAQDVLGRRTTILARCACIFAGALPLLSCGSALAENIIITPIIPTLNAHFTHIKNVTLSILSISSTVTNGIITICMIAILHSSKSAIYFKDTPSGLDKILRGTLQTGSATTALAILSVVLFIGVPLEDRAFYIFPWFPMGKSYVVSLLSLLNGRVTSNNNATTREVAGVAPGPQLPTRLSTLAFVPGRTPVTGVTNGDIVTSGENNRGLSGFIRSLTTTITGRHRDTGVLPPIRSDLESFSQTTGSNVEGSVADARLEKPEKPESVHG